MSDGTTERAPAGDAYHDNLGGIVGATDRPVVLGRAAWDRAEGRFVAFHALADPVARDFPWARVVGHYVTITQLLSSAWLPPVQVTIYDTARLPALRGP